MIIHGNPETDDITDLHSGPIECAGCKEKFCLTMRKGEMDDSLKYCGNCYAHVYSIKEYQDIIDHLNPIQVQMWEIKVSELPKEVLDIVTFIGGKD